MRDIESTTSPRLDGAATITNIFHCTRSRPGWCYLRSSTDWDKARLILSASCRTIFAPVASAMTCVVAVLSAFTNLRWLLGCAMAFGFVFGWHWSLMPVRSTLPFATVACIPTFF